MVSACIYLEGGGGGSKSKTATIHCQRAFHKLLERMGFSGRKPRLVACGGRREVYDKFRIAQNAAAHGYVAMWIDSEEPMSNIEEAWKHLAAVKTVPRWQKPEGAADDQVLFMTTCMETWILVDHDSLRKHFGQELQESALPARTNVENLSRENVQQSLARATRNCPNAYQKGAQSYQILGELDPLVLQKHLPGFARVQAILRKRL